MKRWLPISIFVIVILVFFVSGRIESTRRSQAITRSLPYAESGGAPGAGSHEHVMLTPHAHTLPESHNGSASPQLASGMAVAITAIFGSIGLWMVLSKSSAIDDERRRWALGTLGVIIGYWLRT